MSFLGEAVQCPHCRLRTTIGESSPARSAEPASTDATGKWPVLAAGVALVTTLVALVIWRTWSLHSSEQEPRSAERQEAVVGSDTNVATLQSPNNQLPPKKPAMFPSKLPPKTNASSVQLQGWLVPGGKALYRVETNGSVNTVMLGYGPAAVGTSNILTIRDRTLFVLNSSNSVVSRIPVPKSLTNIVALAVIPGNRIALLDGRSSTAAFLDRSGKLLKTVPLGMKANTRSQQMDSVVLGNELFVSGSGLSRLAAVDLKSFKVRTVRGITELGRGWGRMTFDGTSLLVARQREVWSFTDGQEKPARVYSSTNGPITGLHSFGKEMFTTENSVSKLSFAEVFDSRSGANGQLHRFHAASEERTRLLAGLNEPMDLMPLIGPEFAPLKRVKPRRPRIPPKNTAAIVVSGSEEVSRVQPNGYVTPLARGYSHTRVANGFIYSAMNRVIRVSDLNGRFLRQIAVPQGVPYYVGFVVLPRDRFAFLDNRNNAVHITDESGRYVRGVSLSRADTHLHSMDGVVVGNELVINDDGHKRLVAINLLTFGVRALKTGVPLSGAITYENGVYYFGSGKSILSMPEKTMEIRTIGILPNHNATGIAVNGDKLFIVVNGLLQSKTSLRNKRATRNGELYEFNLNSKSVRKIRSGLDYPQGVDLLK